MKYFHFWSFRMYKVILSLEFSKILYFEKMYVMLVVFIPTRCCYLPGVYPNSWFYYVLSSHCLRRLLPGSLLLPKPTLEHLWCLVEHWRWALWKLALLKFVDQYNDSAVVKMNTSYILTKRHWYLINLMIIIP